LGSGTLKILLPPQLLHNEVFNLIGFFSHSFEPGLCLLLWSTSFSNAAIVHYASGGVETVTLCFCLSNAWWALILSVVWILL
jgi:hypothetical protein